MSRRKKSLSYKSKKNNNNPSQFKRKMLFHFKDLEMTIPNKKSRKDKYVKIYNKKRRVLNKITRKKRRKRKRKKSLKSSNFKKRWNSSICTKSNNNLWERNMKRKHGRRSLKSTKASSTTKRNWRDISETGNKICQRKTLSWIRDSRSFRSIWGRWWRRVFYLLELRSTSQ